MYIDVYVCVGALASVMLFNLLNQRQQVLIDCPQTPFTSRERERFPGLISFSRGVL